jgi:hypothetical protein
MKTRSVFGFKGVFLALVLACGAGLLSLYSSDHADVPIIIIGARQDANITDLHVFRNGSNIVFAISTNPAIPPSVTGYTFPSDVTFEISIDTNATVLPADPDGDGGTVLVPHEISEEVTFRIRFRDDGSASIQKIMKQGMEAPPLVGFFAGLRDDPFIRGPRQRRNVGAIVLEVPLSAVVQGQSTLLIWATAKVNEFEGAFQELTGRSLRSMFPENAVLNTLHPKQHLLRAGLRPDVMIFDTALPAAFPNGRALTDDVVDLVGDTRVLSSDSPFPTTNDLPFLTAFPYLAAPHPAP